MLGAGKRLEGLLGAMKMSKKEKATIVGVGCRSSGLHGTQVKSYTKHEVESLRKTDARVFRDFIGMSRIKMKKMALKDSDLDREHVRIPFVATLQHHRAMTFGHILRRPDDFLPKQLLLGRVLPKLEEAKEELGIDAYCHPHTCGNGEQRAKSERVEGIYWDNVKFFEEVVGVPVECVGLLCAPIEEVGSHRSTERKRLFESMVNYSLVDQTKAHYYRGNEADAENVDKAIGNLVRRRGICREQFELVEDIILRGRCFVCREEGGMFRAGGKENLREHLVKDHAMRERGHREEEARSGYRAACEHFRKAKQEKQRKMEEDYQEFFRRDERENVVSQAGRVGRGFPKFHCLKCDLTYATTIEAMVQHAESRKNGECVFVGKCDVDEGNLNRGFYNPSGHRYNSQTGSYWFSTQAKLNRVTVPCDVFRSSSNIHCRKCSKFLVPFDNLCVRGRVRAAKRMMGHEATCKKTKVLGGGVEMKDMPDWFRNLAMWGDPEDDREKSVA